MKYNPLKQHVHTDLITHYTGIDLHIQMTALHVRGRHEEFWSNKFAIDANVNSSYSRGPPLLEGMRS